MKLTFRQVRAARCAISAMLAGADGEGDWPPEVTRRDLDGAFAKLCDEEDRLEKLETEKRKATVEELAGLLSATDDQE